jgi:gamma-glutamyl:cysteine ligase YbdK (ATP-grasp superfamily)
LFPYGYCKQAYEHHKVLRISFSLAETLNMGLSIDKEEFEAADHLLFVERLNQSLEVLDELLCRPGFGEGPTTLGAELELSIIDSQGWALPINRSLLAQSLDSHLQLELDRFNLEYNLTPILMSGNPFSALEAELGCVIRKMDALAGMHGGRVVPIGILPTLRAEDLQSSAMSDLPRYRALSSSIRGLRRSPFMIRIDGMESLSVTHDDVTLEGANTSFQVHLRVPPNNFARVYNAAQLVTPIALALGANSPIFLEHRLWDETRVALFKQAIDSRPLPDADWQRPARVSFGHGWVRQGAHELFAEAVRIHSPLLPITGEESPLESLRNGMLPRLDELRLHQGTVWRWNRAIYDPEEGGHLRIELRTLPAGPTPQDMAANAAFLVGMALGLQSDVDRLLPHFPFDYAHRNFYRAAQHGLDANLLWPTDAPPSPQEVSVGELALELLPIAERGLAEFGVQETEIHRMLNIIRARINSRITPARWQRHTLSLLEPRMSRSEALVKMLERYIQEMHGGKPVTEWSMEL